MTISSWLHVPDNNSDDVRAILNSESWLDAGVSQRHEQNFQMNLSQTCTALRLEQEPERTRAARYTIRVSPRSAAHNDLRIRRLPSGVPQTPSKRQCYLNLVDHGVTTWDEPKYASNFRSIKPERSMQHPPHRLQNQWASPLQQQ